MTSVSRSPREGDTNRSNHSSSLEISSQKERFTTQSTGLWCQKLIIERNYEEEGEGNEWLPEEWGNESLENPRVYTSISLSTDFQRLRVHGHGFFVVCREVVWVAVLFISLLHGFYARAAEPLRM